MAPEDIRTGIVESLRRVAPEVDPASIDPAVSFREQFDLDSMDLLNFMAAIHGRFGIDIPETDYPRLLTLDSAVSYVAGWTGAP